MKPDPNEVLKAGPVESGLLCGKIPWFAYAARRGSAGANCSAKSLVTKDFTHDSHKGRASSAVAQSRSSTFQ